MIKNDLDLKKFQSEESVTSCGTSGAGKNSGSQNKNFQKLDDEYPLPEKYNVNKIMLQVKNPKWIHMYWEYTDERLEEIVSQAGYNEVEEVPLILRVYDLTTKDQSNYYDINITRDHESWYLGGLEPEHLYQVELGVLNKQSEFYPMLESNQIKTPANDISDLVAEEWMTVNEKLEKIYILSGAGKLNNNSSLDAMKEIRKIVQQSSLRTGYSSL